jgi:hypothetical protein
MKAAQGRACFPTYHPNQPPFVHPRYPSQSPVPAGYTL